MAKDSTCSLNQGMSRRNTIVGPKINGYRHLNVDITEEKSKTFMHRETPAVANNSSSRSNSMLKYNKTNKKL